MNKPKNLKAAAKALKRQGPKKTYILELQWKTTWKVEATDEEHANEIAMKEWENGGMNRISNNFKPTIIKTFKRKSL